MLLTIFTTIIGALCITGILAAVKSRWLYLITPKLYLNTPISDGQILSFTIFNAGFLPEEDIVITFKQVCKFELIATSKSTLLINDKKITIPKIAKFESMAHSSTKCNTSKGLKKQVVWGSESQTLARSVI